MSSISCRPMKPWNACKLIFRMASYSKQICTAGKNLREWLRQNVIKALTSLSCRPKSVSSSTCRMTTNLTWLVHSSPALWRNTSRSIRHAGAIQHSRQYQQTKRKTECSWHATRNGFATWKKMCRLSWRSRHARASSSDRLEFAHQYDCNYLN